MILLNQFSPKCCIECGQFSVCMEHNSGFKDWFSKTDANINIYENCPIIAKIPNNATNGEVIMALLGLNEKEAIVNEEDMTRADSTTIIKLNGSVRITSTEGYDLWFTLTWWNSPYERK